VAETCFDVRGRAVRVKRRLTVSEDAEVFALAGNPSRVAKVYKRPASERTSKLQAMIANAPPDPAVFCRHSFVCWPESLIHNGEGECIGFLAPREEPNANRPLLSLCDLDSQGRIAARITWPYLVRVAINVCGIFETVHSQGHVVGCINERNFLVSDDASCTLTDCDSVQVIDNETGVRYSGTMASAPFIPPELQGAFGELELNTSADHFALAVVIFMLLMDGVHPFEGVWRQGVVPPALEENIKAGRFSYAKAGPLSPNPDAPPFEILPLGIRKLFERCFIDGDRDASLRPTAWEWHNTLKQLDQRLEVCPSNRNHVFSAHLEDCPWCERKAARKESTAFPSVLATPSTWRKHFAAFGSRPLSRAFPINAGPHGRPTTYSPRSRFASDLLGLLVVTLLGGALILYLLFGVLDVGTQNPLLSGVVENLAALIGKTVAAQGLQFEPLILCQSMDRFGKPIGEASTFKESDIRAHGLAAFIGYKAHGANSANVEIRWSGDRSGSSGSYSLPRLGPLFVRLGDDFQAGSYRFSLVVDGVTEQSSNITIYSR
jgi:DNA-binding helix-hairpin-helix protein with protein kinase domain